MISSKYRIPINTGVEVELSFKMPLHEWRKVRECLHGTIERGGYGGDFGRVVVRALDNIESVAASEYWSTCSASGVSKKDEPL